MKKLILTKEDKYLILLLKLALSCLKVNLCDDKNFKRIKWNENK